MRVGLMLRWLLSASLVLLLGACGGGGGGGGESSPPPAPPPLVAPSISTQPQALAVDDGASASFSVVAAGTGALQYQWQRNGQDINGAIAANYNLPAASLDDHLAQYRVLVSNAAGSVSSQAVQLTVRAVAPSIATQPQALTVIDGERAAFAVAAKGSKPLSYSWQRNGLPIAGAAAESLTLDPATLADHGATFSVKVGNVAGTVSSEAVALSVTPVPAQISVQPLAQTVLDGDTVRFAVTAKGSGSLAYQWQVDGKDIANATAPSYTLSASYADNGKRFSVKVSNAYGSASSEAVLLKVDPRAPVAAGEAKSVTLTVGDPASFSVAASGTQPMSFQWERSDDAGMNWKAIAGATGTGYELSSATLAWAETRLRVRVSNIAGTVASAPVQLKVLPNVRVFAGTAGGRGYADGRGAAVRFSYPGAVAVDPQGNVYIPDSQNSVIRKYGTDGQVSTFAGSAGQGFTLDGPLAVARFTSPRFMTADRQGNLFVVDGSNTVVRKISLDGQVSLLAGQPFQPGHVDGSGALARFRSIVAMVADAQGNLLVADSGDTQAIRRITPDGQVSTIAGSPGRPGATDGKGEEARFRYMRGLALDREGNLFIADQHAVRKMTSTGQVSTYAGVVDSYGNNDGGHRTTARFGYLSGLGFDAEGQLYLSENGSVLKRIDLDGQILSIVGHSSSGNQEVDGLPGVARLVQLESFTLSPDGSRFYQASSAGTLRSISLNGRVETLAGQAQALYQTRLGPGWAARFYDIQSLSLDADGRIYVGNIDYQNPMLVVEPSGDVRSFFAAPPEPGFNGGALTRDAQGNSYLMGPHSNRLMQVDARAGVRLLAGNESNETGHRDGRGEEVRFNQARALVRDSAGNFYVADSLNHVIRKIDTTGLVSTIAGVPGRCGHRDGPAAQAEFCTPAALVFDALGRLLVADWGTHTVRRIDATGQVSTFAGQAFSPGLSNGYVSRFKEPAGLAFDAEGNLYVSDSGNAVVRRISPDGFAIVVMGTGVKALYPGLNGPINAPSHLVVRPNGRLVVATESALITD